MDGNGADNLLKTMVFQDGLGRAGRDAGFPGLRKGGGGVEHGAGCGRDSGAGGPARDGTAAARARGRAARCGWGQGQPVGVAGPLRGAGRVGRAKKRAGPAALLGWIRWG